MAYDFYLGEMLFPIPPENIKTTIKSKNETVTLINDGEVSILKTAGLTTGSFTLLLPNTPYPYARYINGFQNAKAYLDHLEQLKLSKQPFQWIISRRFPTGKTIFNTNLTVTLEDYTIKDDAKKAGFDILVDVKLKQYRPYGTKTYSVDLPPAAIPIALPSARHSAYTGNTKRITRDQELIPSSDGRDGSYYYYEPPTTKTAKATVKKKQTYTVQIPGMGALQTQAYSEAEAIKNVTPDYWKGTILVNGKSYDAATKKPVSQSTETTAQRTKADLGITNKTTQSTYTPTANTPTTQNVIQKAADAAKKVVTYFGSAISNLFDSAKSNLGKSITALKN